MPKVADPRSGPRRTRVLVAASALAAIALGGGWLALRTPEVGGAEPKTSPLALAASDESIPDDTVLLEQLEHAVDLRRRENFDRVLDARDPGELVEHATLTEAALDRRVLGIDTSVRRGGRAVRIPVPSGERLGQRGGGGSQGHRLHAPVASHPSGRGRRARCVRMLQLSLEGRSRRSRYADAERVHARRRRADQRGGSAQSSSSARSGSDRLPGARDERRAARPGGRRPASERKRKDTGSSRR